MNALQVTWFCLIGILITGYIILDGFDLGVGFWHLFTRKGTDRSALMRSIMPYWDGNEVWLLTAGGAAFAAFPAVYATVFSGLYMALMLVLFGLIFRAVAIEFTHQSESPSWRGAWGIAFALGSIVPALLFGVAMGNILRGLPLDASGNYTGTFFGLLNPYSLLVGLAGLAMFATHGALFAAIKTSGELSKLMQKRAQVAWAVYLSLFVGSFTATAFTQPQLMASFNTTPVLWMLPVMALIGILAVGHLNHRDHATPAFLASCSAMAGILATLAAALFPNMVPAINNPALSLTLANSSSSHLTLKTMLILAAIGLPLVLVYTVWVHLMFRGKADKETTY